MKAKKNQEQQKNMRKVTNPRQVYMIAECQKLLALQAKAPTRPEKLKWTFDIFNFLLAYIDVLEELRMAQKPFPETVRQKLLELYETESTTEQERQMYLMYMDQLCPLEAQQKRQELLQLGRS